MIQELVAKVQSLHGDQHHVDEISVKLETEFTLRKAEKRRTYELTQKLTAAGKGTSGVVMRCLYY